MKSAVFTLCCAFLLLLPGMARAQAIETAFRLVNLSAGVEYSNFNPGYGPYRLSGAGAYADLELLHGIGAEAEARFLHFNGSLGEEESTYLLGVRYAILGYGPVRPYVKVLGGAGRITYPSPIGYGSYAVIEPAGGLDVLLGRHWRVRGEYEYQLWPSAPGGFSVNNPPSLKPNGASLGLGYRF